MLLYPRESQSTSRSTDSISAGLVRDARAVGRDLTSGRAVVLGGSLGRVEFSWAWDLSSALVKDVGLTVAGVRVSLTLEDGTEGDNVAACGSSGADEQTGEGRHAPSTPLGLMMRTTSLSPCSRSWAT